MKYLIMATAALLSGCASNKTLYEWGGYQPALVNYYKNQDVAAFETKVREALAKGEAAKKVAPGLHAELGYLLYARGDFAEASRQFALEKELFPESSVLMDKMVTGANSAKPNEGNAQ